jgi:fructan beta-fructosidase
VLKHVSPAKLAALVLATVAWLVAGNVVGGAAAAPTADPYRPVYHYSAAQNFMNDPNGLIYHNGIYHMFYQYNPYGTTAGNGSWGHATSTDLVHWKQQPVAIPTDATEDVWSGSVVFDKHNTSGLGTRKNPPMVAMYTSFLKADGTQRQALAYSLDDGKTWTKYAGNPVIDIHSINFRDPKVFWYAPTHSWRVVVALSDLHEVSIYSSPDLKTWTHESYFGPAGVDTAVWECPDLFPMPVNGNPKRIKWVFTVNVAGKAQYLTGAFNGTTFTADEKPYVPPPGTLIGDGGFEGNNYGNWTAAGTAFGIGPAHSASPTNGAIGNGWVDSYGTSDSDTGTLTSPTFTINQNYINFLMAGGNHPYVPGGLTAPPAGTTIEDFEGDALPGWTGTGDFVGITPSKETGSGQVGSGVLDTCQAACDTAEGTVTSPSFTIDHRYLDVLVGGGNHPLDGAKPTAVAVLVNGNVVASVTGNNSGSLNWQAMDLSAYAGQQAQLQVIDQSDGSNGWGHLIVDNPVLSDTRAVGWANQTGANLIVNGQVVRSATGNNSPGLDWGNWNVSTLQGQQAQVQIVDQNNGSDWAHTIADNFEQAGAPAINAAQRAHWIDWGNDFYAAVTYNDAPHGQRLMVGWMSNWDYAQITPTGAWRGEQSVTRKLTLQSVNGQLRMIQTPVSLAKLVTETTNVKPTTVSGTKTLSATGTALQIDATLRPTTSDNFGIDVRVGPGQRTQIGYDTTTQELYVDRTAAGDASFSSAFAGIHRVRLDLAGKPLTLKILVDSSSVEVFANNGLVSITDLIFPDAASQGIEVFAQHGSVQVKNLKIATLGAAITR